MAETIQVDVWADVACPWCYIGKVRFERGLALFATDPAAPPVEVRHRSYQLAPDLPEGTVTPEVEYLAQRKGMDRDQVEAMFAQVRDAGRGDGIDFRFDSVLAVNTRKAHALLQFARLADAQSALLDELFADHFTRGLDLSDDEVLLAAAARVGIDEDGARAALADPAFATTVDADIDLAMSIGVQGVPFYVLGGMFAVSGAQPADVFAEALREVVAQRAAPQP
jgi:predicted DsbA family dithiol-disulfide isomerase